MFGFMLVPVVINNSVRNHINTEENGLHRIFFGVIYEEGCLTFLNEVFQ